MTDVSEKEIASIFRVEKAEQDTNFKAGGKRYVPTKMLVHLQRTTRHYIPQYNTFITTGVKTSLVTIKVNFKYP
jgi:hypothetical protein